MHVLTKREKKNCFHLFKSSYKFSLFKKSEGTQAQSLSQQNGLLKFIHVYVLQLSFLVKKQKQGDSLST